MLHQVVVGVAGEGQGVEPEGVHRRHPEQIQSGSRSPQVGQVEVDQVVPQQEVRSLGQFVQPCQRPVKVAANFGDGHRLARVRPHAGQSVDAVVRPAHLQVQRETARQAVARSVRRRGGTVPAGYGAS